MVRTALLGLLLYEFCRLQHGSVPDIFLVLFEVMQQFAVRLQRNIKTMASTHTMEKKNK